VATRKGNPPVWTFGRKFEHWLVDQGTNLTAWCKVHGVPQSGLQANVKAGRKLSPSRLRLLARLTGLPAGYWLADDIPYPPPAEYLGLKAEAVQLLDTLNETDLRDVVALLRDEADRRRTLAMRRASRS